jgi:prepilin-type N-terminal cleavage/methylation domain-containing protein
MKKKYFKFKTMDTGEGYTLLEMLVVIFIISLLLGIFLTNYTSGNNSNNLAMGAQQLASDIRTAQNKSLGSVTYNHVFPLGGWGVHIDTTNKTSYILFADLNGNKIYDAGEGDVANGGQTLPLPSYVTVDSIVSNDAGNPNPTSLDITFLPPDPVTRIYDGTGTSSVASIHLKESIKKRLATTTVNVLGLIQVN